MEVLSIGELARRVGVGVETIRYYERIALIEEPPRAESGYRQYPPDAVARVRFIKRAKTLGFTLKEISELLSLRVDSRNTCEDVKIRAETKIEDIVERIEALQEMRRALTKLTALCRGTGPISKCPIIEVLETLEEEE